MKSQHVYDLPTRFFHWLFTSLFILILFIAKGLGEDSSIFPYHMMLGIILFLSTILRLIWGFIGSKYARFSSFSLTPAKLFDYSRGVLDSSAERYAGHNPASSWGAMIMFGLVTALGISGYVMSTGYESELFEEFHEVLANIFIVVVIAHLAGLILHSFRHQDGIGWSMVNGHKTGLENSSGITGNHSFVSLLFLLSISLFSSYLFTNYNPENQTLSVFGRVLQLGEIENEREHGGIDDWDQDHDEHMEDDEDDDD